MSVRGIRVPMSSPYGLFLALPNPRFEDHGDPRVDPQWAYALGQRVWNSGRVVDPLFDQPWLHHGLVVRIDRGGARTTAVAVVGPHADRLAAALHNQRPGGPHGRSSRRTPSTSGRTGTVKRRRLAVYTTWQALGAALETRRCPYSPLSTDTSYANATLPTPVRAVVDYVLRTRCHSVDTCSPVVHPLFQRIVARRAVKRAWEVKRIRRACQVTTDALEATRAAIPTFPDLAAFRSHLLAELAKRLPREVTAEALHAEADGTTERGWLAYAPIVTVGGPCPGVGIEKVHPKGFVNHVFGPTRDDVILVDVGVRIDGYCADITRTFPAGTAFSPTHQDLYDLVKAMYTQGASMLKPGVSYAAIGAAVRATMVDGLQKMGYKEYGAGPGGWSEYMPHGLGHMVGLQVHDAPELHEGDYDTLRAGYVLTVEPGVYVDDMCVRIENTILVTATGHEVLSRGCEW